MFASRDTPCIWFEFGDEVSVLEKRREKSFLHKGWYCRLQVLLSRVIGVSVLSIVSHALTHSFVFALQFYIFMHEVTEWDMRFQESRYHEIDGITSSCRLCIYCVYILFLSLSSVITSGFHHCVSMFEKTETTLRTYRELMCMTKLVTRTFVWFALLTSWCVSRLWRRNDESQVYHNVMLCPHLRYKKTCL